MYGGDLLTAGDINGLLGHPELARDSHPCPHSRTTSLLYMMGELHGSFGGAEGAGSVPRSRLSWFYSPGHGFPSLIGSDTSHSRRASTEVPVTSSLPSVVKCAERNEQAGGTRRTRCRPVSTSTSFRSASAYSSGQSSRARVLPSGLEAMARIPLNGPGSAAISLPEATSHSFTSPFGLGSFPS